MILLALLIGTVLLFIGANHPQRRIIEVSVAHAGNHAPPLQATENQLYSPLIALSCFSIFVIAVELH
jgi:hypothetical protein